MSNDIIDNDIAEIREAKPSGRKGKRIKFNLPNAQNVYILGIISIPATLLYFAGCVFAIMAIVRYKKDLPLYKSDPNKYAKSYQKLKKGYILSWISLGLTALGILTLIIAISMNMS